MNVVSIDHYENFPVASWLCPPRMRDAIVAIYRFARVGDDIADEGSSSPQERIVALSAYRRDLHAVFDGQAPSPQWAYVFGPLSQAQRAHQLPVKPLDDLLSAFGRDAGNPRYESREDLLGYCALSANPVGRLVLHLHGIDDARLLRQSDAICTALQLINFWQDLSVDLPRGRVYVPNADLQAHRLGDDDLRDVSQAHRFVPLVRELCAWAEKLMCEGAPLARRVPGRGGWELRLVVQGGLRILEKIAAMGYLTRRQRPTLSRSDAPRLLWRAVFDNVSRETP